MDLNKPLNQIQLLRWFNEKYRDDFMVKSPYDKQAHRQILNLIENDGKPSLEDSDSIKKQLDEIQAAIERNHKFKLLNRDALREELKFFIADKDLTIKDVAGLIEKDRTTVWQFLHKKVKPQDKTVYRIRKLVGDSQHYDK